MFRFRRNGTRSSERGLHRLPVRGIRTFPRPRENGNNLFITSAADWADNGVNDHGVELVNYFTSTDHVEWVVGADNIGIYLPDLFA